MNDSLIIKNIKFTQTQIDSIFNEKGINAHYVNYPTLKRSDTISIKHNDDWKKYEPKAASVYVPKKGKNIEIFNGEKYIYDNEFKGITFFLIISFLILRILK